MLLIGNGNINATGNDLRNTITGNAGINVLTGKGGDDSYVVQNTADQVIELANGGTDYVTSSASFTLGNHVEHLVLSGNGNVNGTGNGLNNRLVGNAGTNVLTGGNGDDRYVVQNAGDQVVELANQGIDTVESSVSFTLANHVEQLVLIGNANIDGTGNALDNGLYGNAGINLLRGGRQRHLRGAEHRRPGHRAGQCRSRYRQRAA